MTNLSKDLCEICGIEPKKVEKRCKECNLNMEECGCFDCYKEIYPDFEQPENFVKLFSLPIKIESSEPTETIIHILARHFHIFDVEDFLSALCKYLTGYNDYGAQIIEAIKETEWVYG